jgi:replicative DNA helicase
MIRVNLPTSQTFSLEAEMSVIGSILYEPEIIDEVVVFCQESGQ